MTDSNSNTGNRNTGYWNTGNRNTGNRNTGYSNTGYSNTGNRNTGNRNTGDRNTGDWNTGDWNTGNWNTGDWNTGYFCEQDGPVLFFDKPCDLSRGQAQELMAKMFNIDLPCGAEWVDFAEMTEEERAENTNAKNVGGYLKKQDMPLNESLPIWWENAEDDQKKMFTDLPNFDPAKFYRMYGVDVAAKVTPKEVVIDGIRYVRA